MKKLSIELNCEDWGQIDTLKYYYQYEVKGFGVDGCVYGEVQWHTTKMGGGFRHELTLARGEWTKNQKKYIFDKVHKDLYARQDYKAKTNIDLLNARP
tara:strand:- start:7696 stop:7989 length:294 start_codon:yes stop_codon:yes gene_type:complete